MMLEREAELARVVELLDDVRCGDGRLLLIVGPAGIGKTCLLEECARAALARDMTVLRARGDADSAQAKYQAASAVRPVDYYVMHAYVALDPPPPSTGFDPAERDYG